MKQSTSLPSLRGDDLLKPTLANLPSRLCQDCRDEAVYSVIANAVKQSIKTQMKYKTQNLNADSINLNDLIKSTKIDLQVWASYYAHHATKILADFLAMTKMVNRFANSIESAESIKNYIL